MTWEQGCIPFLQDRVLQSVTGPGPGAFGEGKQEGKQVSKRADQNSGCCTSAVSMWRLCSDLGLEAFPDCLVECFHLLGLTCS